MTAPNSQADHLPATSESTRADAILSLLDRPLAPADLLTGTELAALPAESGRRKSVRLLVFRLGAEIAALPAAVLRRVTPATRTRPIPHRSGGVLRGVCNVRGELVLCADLHRLLGLPARNESADSFDSRRMIVVGPTENSWVFEVDGLESIESVDPTTFREPPVTLQYSIGDFTSGVTDIGGRCITILDGERILRAFKAGLT